MKLSDFKPHVLLLSGPPTSGKDSLSAALSVINPRFELALKHKDSHEGSPHHIIINPHDFDQMLDTNAFIQWHRRYGRRYGLAKHTLSQALENGKFPIVHTGRLENFQILHHALDDKLSILLECDKETLLSRLRKRHPHDKKEQKTRFNAALVEMEETNVKKSKFDIVFSNNGSDIYLAAEKLQSQILKALQKKQFPPPYEV